MDMKKVAIIGGGVSGLAALHFLKTRHSAWCDAVLLEKENRLGGTTGTERIGGFISEWGPNGFLDRVPLTLQLVDELGLRHLLAPAESQSGRRFIYVRGKLHEISASPVKFMTSPLLSAAGRMRLMKEPFVKPKRDWDVDESVFDFAARRIGPEAARTLIDPMVSGIYGGDARRLSLRSCFPIMVEMEREHGSLVKAMIARLRAAKQAGKKGAGPAGPAGHLTSFKGGLQTLIDMLHRKYKPSIKLNHDVRRVTVSGGRYLAEGIGGFAEHFDGVICSSPAFAAADITSALDAEMSALLTDIPYASIAVVCLGYRREDVGHNLDGFGFLIPRTEGKRILGCIWSSSIFPDQAPAGMIQLRTMIGGATDPEAATMNDNRLVDIVATDLKSILDISGAPAYVKIFKFSRGIPQFVLGHPVKMAALEQRLEAFPGFQLTGNAYDGIGLNDCVVRSDKVVTHIASHLAPTQ